MGLFTPAWKSKHESKALNAVYKIKNKDRELLIRVVKNSPHASVQEFAIRKLWTMDFDEILCLDDKNLKQRIFTHVVAEFVKSERFSLRYDAREMLEAIRHLSDSKLAGLAYIRVLQTDQFSSKHFKVEDVNDILDTDILIEICKYIYKSDICAVIIDKLSAHVETISNRKLIDIIDYKFGNSEFNKFAQKILLNRKLTKEEYAGLALESISFDTIKMLIMKICDNSLREQTISDILTGRGKYRFSSVSDYDIKFSWMLSYVNSQELLFAICEKTNNEKYQEIVLDKMDDKYLARIVQSNIPSYNYYRSLNSKALEKIKNEDILAEIAINYQTSDIYLVCIEALKRITKQTLLAEVAIHCHYSKVRELAFNEIHDQDQLFRIVIESSLFYLKEAALTKMTDKLLLAENFKKISKKMLEEIVENYDDYNGSKRFINLLIKKLSDKEIKQDISLAILLKKDQLDESLLSCVYEQNKLLKIVKSAKNYDLKYRTIELIKDQSILNELTKRYDDCEVPLRAADKMTDKDASQNAYISIAKNGNSHWSVRLAAAKKINNPDIVKEVHIALLNNAFSEKQGDNIIKLSKFAPDLIKSNWEKIQNFAIKNHTDNPNRNHRDAYYSSDCRHTDDPHHFDNGLGQQYLNRFLPKFKNQS